MLFIGVPYGVLLLILVIKKRHRPALGLFLILFPTILSAVYLLFPPIAVGQRFSRDFPQHWLYALPIVVLTSIVACFGVLLRRRRAQSP